MNGVYVELIPRPIAVESQIEFCSKGWDGLEFKIYFISI